MAVCLKMKAKWGFAESVEEVTNHVRDYVERNVKAPAEIGAYMRKYNKFKDCRPGRDWVIDFLRKFNLSMKCPSALEKTRKAAASDPNIIYGYYDMLQEMEHLKIADRPECIWNIDETSFFTDPRQVKVIAPKGQKTFRTQATLGREAITVMAAIPGAGDLDPPLIIFKGKYIQSTWMPLNPYKGTKLAVTENGWMVSEVIFDWFCRFCECNTQRPLLLVYDGHSTHLTSQVIPSSSGGEYNHNQTPSSHD